MKLNETQFTIRLDTIRYGTVRYGTIRYLLIATGFPPDGSGLKTFAQIEKGQYTKQHKNTEHTI